MGHTVSDCRLMFVVVVLLGACQPVNGAPPAQGSGTPLPSSDPFASQISPIFVSRCQKCHAATAGKGGLSLTSRAAILAGGDSGPAIVPGKPDESLLMSAVRYSHDQLHMPPGGKLSDDEIARLARWVQDGAPWPDDDANLPTGSDDAGQIRGISVEQRSFWSFQKVHDVVVPAVQRENWCQGPIDHFVLARLEERHLMPAPPAERRTLLRRATFDLTGLPPTPHEIQAFLDDDSPNAFSNVIERLLSSPAYGERWGRHWLDVVRYADARDLIQLPPESDFREAWRYRDWVVDSLNRDLPYDQFVTLQLAGDLLGRVGGDQIDKEGLIATGMLAIADFVPGDVDKEKMIADYVNDEIDVVGRAFLGLTLACARCHDHKFDPISTADYHALAGIFFSTRLIPEAVKGNTPLVRVPLITAAEVQSIEDQTTQAKRRIGILPHEIQLLADRAILAVMRRQLADQAPRYLTAACEYLHRAASEPAQTLAEFATAQGYEEVKLARWVKYLDGRPQPRLFSLVAIADGAERMRTSQELGRDLTAAAAIRAVVPDDPARKMLADAALLEFRADDPLIVTNDTGHVMVWPDRAGIADDATIVPGTPGPALDFATIQGQSHRVVRFHGHELLAAQRVVPSHGTMFLVFRAAEPELPGQRLLGWEDSAVGQHGVGIICNGTSGIHAVLRRDGASGDVMVPAPSTAGFQLLTITWGPTGATIHRGGLLMGTNPQIDAVSSAPEINALRIGGAGSGAGPSFMGDLAELRVYATPLSEAARDAVEAELHHRWFRTAPAAGTETNPTDDLYCELMSPRGPFWVGEAERELLCPEETRRQLIALRDELEILKKRPVPEIPRAVTVADGGPVGTKYEGFHDARVLIRGNPANLGPVVPRGFPQVLAGNEQPVIRHGSGRRELAAWLVRPDNPLTARVMANRIWQHHFGDGLVRTSTNFGARGEPPSHPELLDYLAGQFVAGGWSIKAMHRLIMLSSVYQQSSRATATALSVDPENRLLARMSRRWLEAESIRDSLLAVAGRLEAAQGGPAFQDVATPRRSLYLMSVRTGNKISDFASLFDGPNCAAVVEKRNQSVIAPQALFLMNDPWVLELAANLAGRLERELPAGSDSDRIDRLYEITLNRRPTPQERDIGKALIAGHGGQDSWARYCHVLLCTNEFIYVD
jgi:Protein of unknown function (DUF1553)/Protein of unknown function (DUF1549)/Planctomycete cytochrome C